MREFERSAAEASDAEPAAAAAALPTAAAQVLALQRTVGNRATAQLLANRSGGRRMVSRVPEFRPDAKQEPSKNNPWPDCTPFAFEHEAISAWKWWSRDVDAPKRLGDRCDCSLVR